MPADTSLDVIGSQARTPTANGSRPRSSPTVAIAMFRLPPMRCAMRERAVVIASVVDVVERVRHE